MSQVTRYFCPTCGLETHRAIGETTELEVNISYKQPGKETYSRGWWACQICCKDLVEHIQEYMNTQRMNRGISLRAMREQKSNSGCGCGG